MLQNLNDFNENRRKIYRISDKVAWNGIACPDCGEELFDSAPDLTLTSFPPQKNTKCSKCPYTGYRVA